MSSPNAPRILGEGHPLAAVETSLASARTQAVVCLALILGSPVMLVAGRDVWFATVASAALVEAGIGVAILSFRAARRQRIHDMIVAGDVADIDVVHAEVRHLRSDNHRQQLAGALERALADGEHWHEFMPAARPPIGVRNLPAHAAAIRGIAHGLRDREAPIRAIVLVERLAAGGYGSALYEADQAWLGRELTRIRYELEARPDRAARLRDAA